MVSIGMAHGYIVERQPDLTPVKAARDRPQVHPEAGTRASEGGEPLGRSFVHGQPKSMGSSEDQELDCTVGAQTKSLASVPVPGHAVLFVRIHDWMVAPQVDADGIECGDKAVGQPRQPPPVLDVRPLGGVDKHDVVFDGQRPQHARQQDRPVLGIAAALLQEGPG